MRNIKVEYHKVVDILIFNDKHQLALQKRALSDKSFPGHWDFSAGGHIDRNEEAQKAAEREILEELGVSGQAIFMSQEYFQYPDWDPSILRDVETSIFKMFYNGPFRINSKEVEKIIFFDLRTIQKMIDQGNKFHPEFLLTWQKGIVLHAV
ncbi:MAG: hypothetical protein US60_C0010G0045 [Microgenomates group bacterium GW2011_GWC1_37_8]|uniref:Nudix hydrolase domain-containing protein n=1 Tax=Candidatus Woesebacteria bacterium GW2011_GWB1_38_8 TaxID=1618570 RepID=A0A0G0LAY6_9BACT|nr:MAG: hypothetical protein US60_C0010G0045 [Microgenomates group bacterium GW2011_GWC1_37_8]KKQ85035.1 MAG: hypothetical protein UT08_C0011G0053 [Candidatus Woesebacteria bacterium GW2011_GWB1_38_8]